jgi:hypothetical protein
MESVIDKSFDQQFKFIQPMLHWLPFVGKDYTKSPIGKKLLIVGESHYVPAEEDADDGYSDETWTRKFICKEGLKLPPYYVGNPINPLIKNTEKAIFNTQNPTDENKQKLWHSVVYFNLVQRLLESRNSEDRPNDDDFIKGWKVFSEIIEKLQPNICLVLGKSGWGNLGNYFTNFQSEWSLIVPNEKTSKIAFLSKNEYQLKLIFIDHPSGSYGFKYEEWAKIIEQEMNDYISWIKEQ